MQQTKKWPNPHKNRKTNKITLQNKNKYFSTIEKKYPSNIVRKLHRKWHSNRTNGSGWNCVSKLDRLCNSHIENWLINY